jgi:hypothetical protein
VPYPQTDYSSEVLPLDTDAEVPRAHWQEWFSWAFVQAIASAAGVTAEVKQVDSNQIDLFLQTWRPLQGQVRTIALQLKSKNRPHFVDDEKFVVHDLEADRYNRLLEPGNVPRFFVVVAVDEAPAPLVQLVSDSAKLAAGAWWTRIDGPPTDQQYKRIKVPTNQRFDAAGLRAMLLQA